MAKKEKPATSQAEYDKAWENIKKGKTMPNEDDERVGVLCGN